jgi:hypothetical protein
MRGWDRADRRVVAAMLLAAAPGALAGQEGPSATPHTPISYDITVVTSDTGAYLLGEVETGWQLQSVNPVEMELDSTMDVIRVLVDGKPNTRLSRTMYSRDSALVIVPHEKAPGDTLTTRVRYHGIPVGGFRTGTDRSGARAFAGSTAGATGRLWLPMPKGTMGQATVTWNVQASEGQRVVANGELTGIDTLNYGHSTWHFRTDKPIPLDALAVAADHFAVTTLPHPGCRSGCVPATLWTSPGDSAAAAAGVFRRAGEMADWLATLLGPYPYRGLAHVAAIVAPEGRAGASVVLYDERRVHAGQVSEREVARATAAQWFENVVRDSASRRGPSTHALVAYLAELWVRKSRSSPDAAAALPPDVSAVERLHQQMGDSGFFRMVREREGRAEGRTSGQTGGRTGAQRGEAGMGVGTPHGRGLSGGRALDTARELGKPVGAD